MGLLAVACGLTVHYGRSLWFPFYLKIRGMRTVADVMEQYGSLVDGRLAPAFARMGVAFPPDEIALLGLKEEKSLELWGKDGGEWRHIKTYDILGASGTAGPKLREGDHQVPEGVYRVIGLNPNSSYHLSMKLDYPNAFDLKHAAEEGRDQPGSDIFIHGKSASVGCLAIGDEAIEELFVLVQRTGLANARVIIAPNDPRHGKLDSGLPGAPAWLPELYGTIAAEYEKITS